MDLFGFSKSDKEVTLENAQKIKGLEVLFEFISKDEEKRLLNNIDKSTWLTDLKRRVQHYGYKYDYKARRIDQTYYIGKIPDWMTFLCERLQRQNIIDFSPDQAIVNEYISDQGIAPHIDCEPCFGDTIISISLGGQCVMNFQKEQSSLDKDRIPLLLLPQTLVVMKKEARYNWYHGIPGRKSDKFNGTTYIRNRRVSITFRKVITTLENNE